MAPKNTGGWACFRAVPAHEEVLIAPRLGGACGCAGSCAASPAAIARMQAAQTSMPVMVKVRLCVEYTARLRIGGASALALR